MIELQIDHAIQAIALWFQLQECKVAQGFLVDCCCAGGYDDDPAKRGSLLDAAYAQPGI